MGTLGQDYEFLRKTEIAVSSWVVSYAYVEQRNTGVRGLLIEYLPEDKPASASTRSGPGHRPKKTFTPAFPGQIKSRIVTCFYPNTPESLFDSIDAAGSKGKWVHANVLRMGYQIVE